MGPFTELFMCDSNTDLKLIGIPIWITEDKLKKNSYHPSLVSIQDTLEINILVVFCMYILYVTALSI